jgi:hypothetical protein
MRIPPHSLLLPGALILAACGGEQSRPASRDLTLLAPASETTSDAVVSAREMDLVKTETGGTNRSTVRRLPAPRARTVAAVAAPDAGAGTPAPAPAGPATPAADGDNDVGFVTGGAGQALEPGQTVTVVPATSAGVQRGAEPGPYVEPAALRPRRHSHHGDRCIPGRGELIPQEPDAFPGGGSVPNGLR